MSCLQSEDDHSTATNKQYNAIKIQAAITITFLDLIFLQVMSLTCERCPCLSTYGTDRPRRGPACGKTSVGSFGLLLPKFGQHLQFFSVGADRDTHRHADRRQTTPILLSCLGTQGKSKHRVPTRP